MKTLYFVIFIVLFSFSLYQITAQEKRVVHRDGYIITYNESSDELITDIEHESLNYRNYGETQCKDCEMRETAKLDSLYATVFSKEKVEKLGKNRAVIGIFAKCNMQGEIKGLAYKIVKAEFSETENNLLDIITISEMKKLDNILSNYRYEVIRTNCPEADYFLEGPSIYFGYLLEYINTGKSRFE